MLNKSALRLVTLFILLLLPGIFFGNLVLVGMSLVPLSLLVVGLALSPPRPVSAETREGKCAEMGGGHRGDCQKSQGIRRDRIGQTLSAAASRIRSGRRKQYGPALAVVQAGRYRNVLRRQTRQAKSIFLASGPMGVAAPALD